MYIALNPAKATRFTTKGINLTPSFPVAHVDQHLEREFVEAIEKGLADGRLIKTEDDNPDWTHVGQGSVGRVQETEEARIGVVQPVMGDDGKGGQRVVGYVLQFDGESQDGAPAQADDMPYGLGPIVVEECGDRNVKYSATFPEEPER